MNPIPLCKTGFQLWSEFFETSEKQTHLQNHLSTCSHCRPYSNEIEELIRYTKELNTLEEHPPSKLSPQFESQLFQKIDAIENQRFKIKHFLTELDRVFEFLHVPALGLLIALLFWIPTQPKTQTALYRPPPKQSQPLKQSLKVPVTQALKHIARVYNAKNNPKGVSYEMD